MEPPEKNAEWKRKNCRQNNLRRNFRIEKRFKIFVSEKDEVETEFKNGTEKKRPEAKKHDVHSASSEDINCCKSRKNAENKEQKGIEPENRFGIAVAEKSEEKTKKPTGEFAFINGDADAGGQNKNRAYSEKIKKPGSCLDYI